MERGIITMNEYGRVTIPTSTNVWMTEAELSSLLGTIAPTLRAAIRAVYKSGVLKRHEARTVYPFARWLRHGSVRPAYGRGNCIPHQYPMCGNGARYPAGKAVRAKRKTSPVGVN